MVSDLISQDMNALGLLTNGNIMIEKAFPHASLFLGKLKLVLNASCTGYNVRRECYKMGGYPFTLMRIFLGYI